MENPNHHSTSRLILIRFLFQRAVDQSSQPHPLSTLAVLELHDAVEWFLLLAAEVHHAPLKGRPELVEYWNVIAASNLGIKLGYQTQMKHLSDARRQLKHRGVQPAQSDIDLMVDNCTRFFETETPRVFGMSFTSISLSDLIQDESVRTTFKGGEEAAANGDFSAATIDVCRAFYLAHSSSGDSVTRFTDHLDFEYFTKVGQLGEPTTDALRRMANALNKVAIEVSRLQIGGDPQDVKKFFSISPTFVPILGAEADCWIHPDFAPSRDEYRFCEQFALRYILSWQESQSLSARADSDG